VGVKGIFVPVERTAQLPSVLNRRNNVRTPNQRVKPTVPLQTVFGSAWHRLCSTVAYLNSLLSFNRKSSIPTVAR
jgi:hypothetical protein